MWGYEKQQFTSYALWYAGCIDRGESMGFTKPLGATGGFAFIEAVLASVILGAVMCASLMMVSGAQCQSTRSDITEIANQLASQKIEDILADRQFKGYDDISNSAYPSETLDGVYLGFSRSVSIVEVKADDLSTPQTGTGTKKVSVTVSWGDSAADSLTIDMLVGDYS